MPKTIIDPGAGDRDALREHARPSCLTGAPPARAWGGTHEEPPADAAPRAGGGGSAFRWLALLLLIAGGVAVGVLPEARQAVLAAVNDVVGDVWPGSPGSPDLADIVVPAQEIGDDWRLTDSAIREVDEMLSALVAAGQTDLAETLRSQGLTRAAEVAYEDGAGRDLSVTVSLYGSREDCERVWAEPAGAEASNRVPEAVPDLGEAAHRVAGGVEGSHTVAFRRGALRVAVTSLSCSADEVLGVARAYDQRLQ